MKGSADEIAIGSQVRIVAHHWLRGYENGTIVDFQPNGMNRWLVKFNVSYPGGGIDGDKLWLNESHFAEVKRESNAAAEMIGPTMQYPGLTPVSAGDNRGKRALSS